MVREVTEEMADCQEIICMKRFEKQLKRAAGGSQVVRVQLEKFDVVDEGMTAATIGDIASVFQLAKFALN